MKSLLSYLGLGLLLLSLQGCKQEGCTNPDALNYNVVANKDDGSCEFCSEENINVLGSGVYEMKDNRTWSQYYNQTIVNIEIVQKESTYNYTACGQSACYFTLRVENTIDKDINFFEFWMNIPNSGGFSYGINQWNPISIPSGGVLELNDFIVSFPPQDCFAMMGINQIVAEVNSAEFN